jgi:hypothetical protein
MLIRPRFSSTEQGAERGESWLNEYEKAFVERIAKSGIEGAGFADLVREAFEAEYGGEGDALLVGLSKETKEDPGRFASELYDQYGTGALQYYALIIRYVDSGRYSPAEEAEEEAEESDLESIVEEVESNSEQGTASDSPA